MENKNMQELKTPYQVLKHLKEEMNSHSYFKEAVDKGFLDEKKFFNIVYDCIKDNFKRTNKAFILQDQMNFIIKNEIQINMASAISILLDNELLSISAVSPNGELVYKLTETGFDAVKLLNNETNKE